MRLVIMKRAVISVMFGAVMFLACENPQKHDEKQAEKKANEAAQAAESAAEHAKASTENAAAAAVATIQMNINNAMAAIPMPDFKTKTAKNLAEEFHGLLSKLVNANSGKKAGEYVDKLKELKEDYDKKVAKEKLDPADKMLLDTYVKNMLNAVQNAN
ncbi:hypothetical protein [Chitinophaga caeni]|nr:hypothetical protein [Chitinophaga caeni]